MAQAQQKATAGYALLQADRFPFSLPESCVTRPGVGVSLQAGLLIFRSSSLPPNDLATVEAVEECLQALRPNAENPRVTYVGRLRVAHEQWLLSRSGGPAEPLPGPSTRSGDKLFAITRSGTRIAIESYEMKGEHIRLRLSGGGTLDWLREEILRIERADGRMVESLRPPPVAPRPDKEKVTAATTPPAPKDAQQPAKAGSAPESRKTPVESSVRPATEVKPLPPRPEARAPMSGEVATTTSGCCVVQLGSFRVSANAERLARELAAKHPGIRIVSSLSRQGQLMYRVIIPVAGDRAKAEKLVEELRRDGYEAVIVVRR